MKDQEEMRDISGYEKLYAATEDGRIYSYRSKRFLKPSDNGHGYYQVALCKDGIRKNYLIHRLIAATYLPNPENLALVNHKDEDKLNNCVENLEYCTAKYNINYGTCIERSAKSRQKKVICVETQEVFDSINEAAKVVDIVHSGISDCLAGRKKTAGGYHWKYYD